MANWADLEKRRYFYRWNAEFLHDFSKAGDTKIDETNEMDKV